MGKIENCFGTLEEGQAFAVKAYENPILRVTVGVDPNPAGSDNLSITAMAGIVTAMELETPEAESIPYPGIEVTPISIASTLLTRQALHSRRLLPPPRTEVAPTRTLLIMGPVTAREDVRPRIEALASSRKGVLTVSTTPFIREAMLELSDRQHTDPLARAVYDLSKLALSNIWG